MEKTGCLLCGFHEDGHVVFSNKKDKYISKFDELRGQGSRLVMCKKCGFAFQNPRLTRNEVSRIYAKLYRPPIPSREHIENKKKIFREYELKWLKDVIDTDGQGKKILDIGSSEGLFLALFKELGWTAFGVEPSESFSAYSKEKLGLNVAADFFHKDVFKGEKFDLVVARNVLEHLHDPLGFLADIASKMDHNADLFIEVPDLCSPHDNIKYHFYNSTHLYLFTPRTIKNLLSAAGYKTCAVEQSCSHIRVIARKTAEKTAPDPCAGREDHKTVRSLIRRHQLKWYLLCEWKDWIKNIKRRCNDGE